jgi:spore coat protein U-like protein
MLGLVSKPFFAATATASFNVSATVVDTCRIGFTRLTGGPAPITVADQVSAPSVHCVLNSPNNLSKRAAINSPVDVAGSPSPVRIDTQSLPAVRPVDRGRLRGFGPAATSAIGSSQELVADEQALGEELDSSDDYPDSVLVTIVY